MKKALTLFAIVLSSVVLASTYGIIHDQITYSLSEEYYTKFKFIQFGLPDTMLDRSGVSIVGILATWWVGLFLGLILGLVGLLHKSPLVMLSIPHQTEPPLTFVIEPPPTHQTEPLVDK